MAGAHKEQDLNFCKNLRQKEERAEIKGREKTWARRRRDGVYWKGPARRRPEKSKIKWEEPET
jgi:hypothetical protein